MPPFATHLLHFVLFFMERSDLVGGPRGAEPPELSAFQHLFQVRYDGREWRALPQGRWFTHVLGKGVGRQRRGPAKAGSIFVDSYTDLRPQASETRTVAHWVAAGAFAPSIPCGWASGSGSQTVPERPESTERVQRALREAKEDSESTQRALGEHSERPESTQRGQRAVSQSGLSVQSVRQSVQSVSQWSQSVSQSVGQSVRSVSQSVQSVQSVQSNSPVQSVRQSVQSVQSFAKPAQSVGQCTVSPFSQSVNVFIYR